MDKITKILLAMTSKERSVVTLLMEQLKRDYRVIPGIKALAGMKGFFRIRIGQYRIIFQANPKTHTADIKRISRRNEKTYKDL